MRNDDVLGMATQIVVATIGAQERDKWLDVPELIDTIYEALIRQGEKPAAVHTEPAVPIPASVTPDAVICLECGFSGKTLKRHLMASHGLTAEGYRDKWLLPASHPLVAPNYAVRRKELAYQMGLGKKPVETMLGVVVPPKRGRKG